MEQSIEAAMRSLNERAELCGQMAEQAVQGEDTGAHWRRAKDEAHEQTAPLRELLGREWMHPALAGPRRVGGAKA